MDPREGPNPEWQDLHMELVNKFRWAIGSTVDGSGLAINLPYSVKMALARRLTSPLVDLLRELYEKPDLRVDKELIDRVLDN